MANRPAPTGEPAPDPIPETEDPVRFDADGPGTVHIGRNGREVHTGVFSQTDRNQSRARAALAMVPAW